MVIFSPTWSEETRIINVFWMTTVQNMHCIFIINFTFTSTARSGVFLVLLYYGGRNVNRSPCCETRYKLKLTHGFSRRGKHCTVGMLIHRSNSRSSMRMVVLDPGESLTCISSIYAAHSSSSHWPWQNYVGNMVTRVNSHRVLFTVQHCVFLSNISCFIASLNIVYLNEFIIFATAYTMHAHKILSWLNSLT